jgi:hypothetical protein
MWILLHIGVTKCYHGRGNDVYDTQLAFTMNKKIICSAA